MQTLHVFQSTIVSELFGVVGLPVSYPQGVQMGSFHPEPRALSE